MHLSSGWSGASSHCSCHLTYWTTTVFPWQNGRPREPLPPQNARNIDLPESYLPAVLSNLCSTCFPETLGLRITCVVDRAHRVGTPLGELHSSHPRPVIVHYLNYAGKQTLLQHYSRACGLHVDGHPLLLFTDYSVEIYVCLLWCTPQPREIYSCILSDSSYSATFGYPGVFYLPYES